MLRQVYFVVFYWLKDFGIFTLQNGRNLVLLFFFQNYAFFLYQKGNPSTPISKTWKSRTQFLHLVQQQNFQKQNKILMRNKKPRTRITRHKVPNLLNPQQRFDQPTHTASFFTKIENSFKMLQGPARNKSNMSHYSSCGPNDSRSFHQASKNNEKNSMDATEQSKRVVRHHSSLGGQEMQTKQIIPIKKTVKSRLINPKLPLLSNQKSNSGVSEINGTKLAPMPLENILRYREKLLDEALPNDNLLVETISEDSETARTISEQEKFRPTEKNAHPNVWVEMIINGQGKIYDNYDRMIMQKVKGYVRKKYKINHKSMWK